MIPNYAVDRTSEGSGGVVAEIFPVSTTGQNNAGGLLA
jgi:hypothetical protein